MLREVVQARHSQSAPTKDAFRNAELPLSTLYRQGNTAQPGIVDGQSPPGWANGFLRGKGPLEGALLPELCFMAGSWLGHGEESLGRLGRFARG